MGAARGAPRVSCAAPDGDGLSGSRGTAALVVFISRSPARFRLDPRASAILSSPSRDVPDKSLRTFTSLVDDAGQASRKPFSRATQSVQFTHHKCPGDAAPCKRVTVQA